MDSLISPPQNDATVIQNMSDVPASENKIRAEPQMDEGNKNIAVVQCEGFRCLAYQEAEKWRDFQTGKELPEVQSVVFTFSV